ncbi:MAG: 2,3,4,5-tetrahydropyridine-2,6-dicarboxylate N-succinyltransferase, partial [Candidatus Eremiobacteraeota bacterium]|nr:2,3,4,5-tetrahydropyridine-2,6-dicarboxylate N-succinyltransferase [Candidatus Eremiobacteraeota bacterium]
EAVEEVIAALNAGRLRVAERQGVGQWTVNQWVKKAVLLSFRLNDNQVMRAGDLGFYDKVPTKFAHLDAAEMAATGVRVVPPAVARRGSFIAKGAILMPSYVNIGAYVDDGSMVDTWATVGSCAQVGKNVHLSGGVGIGGVLEPPQAMPVIVEDGAFVGSRCIVVEGVRVGLEAVLGAGVVLTASTPIVDVRGGEAVVTKGYVPARAVVIPGTLPKRFAAGEFGTPCALIIGERSESTDQKTSLNAALREYEVAV